MRMSAIDVDVIREVLELLSAHRGRQNSITAEELNQRIGIGDGDSFEGKEVVQYLLYEEEIPIGATRNGYFLIDNRRELHDYVQLLHRSQYRTDKRERAAKRAFDNEFEIERVSPEDVAPK